jgi:beta-lactamase superfamily II metal-dependent hydrolase
MSLWLHFLNVARGDCTIIDFPSGNLTVVDIDDLRTFDPDTQGEILEKAKASSIRLSLMKAFMGESRAEEVFLKQKAESLTDPIDYLDEHFPGRPIFRFIATHPDMDHISGLRRLAARRTISNFWHVGYDDWKSGQSWDGSPYDQRDWDAYVQLSRRRDKPQALTVRRGLLVKQDGIYVWAPTRQLVESGHSQVKPNMASMILRISYGGRVVVMGGDASADEAWAAIYAGTPMDGVSILKASHHGRKTGYHQPSVREMAPWLTITSVGAIEHDATDSYREHSDYTVSLRQAGTIRIEITDEGRIRVSPNARENWKRRT